MKPVFHILKGNHGATYIFNIKNWVSIQYSLKFYNATSIRARILKPAFQAYLFIKGKLFIHRFKSATDINLYLQQVSNTKTNFNLDDNCSVMVAPIQDKITVHHHNNYFQKFAFGNSYPKVQKEAQIYALFKKPLTHFQVSKYYDAIDNNNEILSFKLSNEHIDTKQANLTTDSLVSVLLEFFNTVPQQKYSVKSYVDTLIKDLQQIPNMPLKNQLQTLDDFNAKIGALEFPLGLVHRDFKPWNVLQYKKPLIFDFEEATATGVPLEDLLNFYIDPIINYQTPKQVVNVMLNEAYLNHYERYLNALDIAIPLRFFIHMYAIDRMVFWYQVNKLEISNKYRELSDYLIEQKQY